MKVKRIFYFLQLTCLVKNTFHLSALVGLSSIVGEMSMKRTLQILDEQTIKIIKSSASGREFAQVNGTTTRSGYTPIYSLFPNIPYCNCMSVKRHVIRRERFCCKHFLAVSLAIILGKTEVIEKPKAEFIKLMKVFLRH